MSDERRQRLDAIGFVWDVLASAWEEGFAALMTFKAGEGHCNVPQRHVEGTFKLGTWVNNQRRRGDVMTARESLTEDELAIFDLLTKPEPKLTKAQEVEVKKVARELLLKLQDQLNILDWRARQQTRAAVQSTIRFTLNELPEEPYPEAIWENKVDAVWAYIFSRSQQADSEMRYASQ
jgi:Helicase associated domain/Type I restriction enzyme HindI endonuclease subunit-like, C-terminal